MDSDQIVASVELIVAGNRVQLEIPVTTRAIRPIELLPTFQAMADDFVRLAASDIEQTGAAISCRKGCGACCRQLVAVSQTEARHLSNLTASLPEPRRSAVLARFEQATKRLRREGYLEEMLSLQKNCVDGNLNQFAHDYFKLGIACPFLEEESCSIYSERPIVCREYLVTSDARHCADPAPGKIAKVQLASKAWIALARIEEEAPARFVPFVWLVLAPSWADSNPDAKPPRPGPHLLRDFLARFAASEPPAVPPGVRS